MDIGKEMFDKALAFLNERFGEKSGGVAIVRLENGEYLYSVWTDFMNESANLCAETGAICEAIKLDVKITHSLCLCRQEDNGDYEILGPCGICQERLFYFGPDVLCAISTSDNSVVFKKLSILQPFHWLNKN